MDNVQKRNICAQKLFPFRWETKFHTLLSSFGKIIEPDRLCPVDKVNLYPPSTTVVPVRVYKPQILENNNGDEKRTQTPEHWQINHVVCALRWLQPEPITQNRKRGVRGEILVWVVQDSNPSTYSGYYDWGSSRFSSVSSGIFQDSTSN
jgi:hypothetical protein